MCTNYNWENCAVNEDIQPIFYMTTWILANREYIIKSDSCSCRAAPLIEGDCMRTIKETELEKRIRSRRQEVEREILCSRRQRPFRSRPRDPEEQKILDELCIRNWKRLEAEGKIKRLGSRHWYMDFS